MNDTPISEMTFEQAMSELERIVTQLERGDVPLEDSITLYERGAELKKRCEAKLKEAEQKVAAATAKENQSKTDAAQADSDKKASDAAVSTKQADEDKKK